MTSIALKIRRQAEELAKFPSMNRASLQMLHQIGERRLWERTRFGLHGYHMKRTRRFLVLCLDGDAEEFLVYDDKLRKTHWVPLARVYIYGE